ncbi:MAG: thiamine phosphate synthase [Bacteroidales bacterium]|jgi:thiamine-phosphate pyrophosphorylase|nr:thiamine phosphate synthase [Bacteroidales bacterium]
MKLIVITGETFFKGEAEIVCRLFEAGLERLHVRKPHTSENRLHAFLSELPEEVCRNVVLHDHFSLCQNFKVGGFHLNRRQSHAVTTREQSLSKSCHSIDELIEISNYQYVFISPVFDSISKNGYQTPFSREDWGYARERGLIQEKVYALGGITPSRLSKVANFGFAGAVVLGWLWGEKPEKQVGDILSRFHLLQEKMSFL